MSALLAKQHGEPSPGQFKVLHRAVEQKTSPGTANIPADRHDKGKAVLGTQTMPTYAKVTAGDLRGSRPNDTRGPPLEGWKAARERRNRSLLAAAGSHECAAKNRARFDHLRDEKFTAKRYPKLEFNVPLTAAKTDEIRSTFHFLRQSQPQPSAAGVVVKTTLNTQQLANRMDFLHRKTFVLCMVDVTLTPDAVAEWSEKRGSKQTGEPMSNHVEKMPKAKTKETKSILSTNIFDILHTENEEPPLIDKTPLPSQQKTGIGQTGLKADARSNTQAGGEAEAMQVEGGADGKETITEKRRREVLEKSNMKGQGSPKPGEAGEVGQLGTPQKGSSSSPSGGGGEIQRSMETMSQKGGSKLGR
ncbi:hypothetical protein R1sor_011787 [Riccia sorocarpa]|uniref:Uncharacterized protein n=1 Tax=Riccia sorocarpa TaxID=122646 RepID=A0ABD3I371_9MARC